MTHQDVFAAAFKQACGRDGAHVIYDPVGGDYAEPALRAIAWQGRYLVIGFPAGIPRIPLNLALVRHYRRVTCLDDQDTLIHLDPAPVTGFVIDDHVHRSLTLVRRTQ